MSDENIDLLTENFSTASEEEKLALSSAFDGKATPEEIELLKNSEQNQSETVQKLLQQIIDNQKGIVLYQSAMYKSPLENFEDFYNQVFEKEDNSKQNGENLKKSFFEFKNQNVDLRNPHDTVIHVENGHNLEISEWADFLKNITTPTDITISNKPRYDGLPLLLKYNFNGKTYGAVIEFFENKKPILTTVFSDEEKNVVNWIKENSHFQAKNISSVTTKGMLLDNKPL